MWNTTVNDIATAINNKLQVDLAVLDFSKALDKVAHVWLLILWSERKLTGMVQVNRTEQVVIEGQYSRPCDITSGVPQNSVLGPALFQHYQLSNTKK